MATKLTSFFQRLWQKLKSVFVKSHFKPEDIFAPRNHGINMHHGVIDEYLHESQEARVVKMPVIEPVDFKDLERIQEQLEEKKQATEDIARQLLETLKPKPIEPKIEIVELPDYKGAIKRMKEREPERIIPIEGEIIINLGKSAGEETIKAPIIPSEKFRNAALALESPNPGSAILPPDAPHESPFNITGRRLSLTKLWNNSLVLSEKDPEPRDYCRASELGKPLIDRYLTMQGVKQSNPPNERSRRKFFSGNVWEFIAGLVLNQMGIIQDQQTTVTDDSMAIPVIGHLDYLIGGKPNYDQARKVLSSLAFDEAMTTRFMRVIDNFESEYGYNEIEQCVHEIKSCSEYVLEKIQEGGSVQGHDLQVGHYIRGLKLPYGIITYISKNDALMAEKLIRNTDDSKKLLAEDLALLKGYRDANQQPPPAPLITFENKFSKNFGVEYSSYLNLVYGFETPEDYRNAVQSKIASWNRLLARLKNIADGKTTPTGKALVLTEKNKVAIDEIAAAGFGDAQVLAKQAKIVEEESEEPF